MESPTDQRGDFLPVLLGLCSPTKAKASLAGYRKNPFLLRSDVYRLIIKYKVQTKYASHPLPSHGIKSYHQTIFNKTKEQKRPGTVRGTDPKVLLLNLHNLKANYFAKSFYKFSHIFQICNQ